jgi:hypothetical protein
MKIILWAIGLYLLYKLIFDFILPVYQTTKRVRKQFREVQSTMQAQMQAHMQAQQNAQRNSSPGGFSSPNSSSKRSGGAVGDYIDFEEIK